ncbi:hypothetical protein LY76DRAFT_290468 [Colletotrichum caudatum]|nr:hypothetical protein LY76DRAFT_290468 [Colletotrichum caudatum]
MGPLAAPSFLGPWLSYLFLKWLTISIHETMLVVPCRDAITVWLLSSTASQVGILVAKSQDGRPLPERLGHPPPRWPSFAWLGIRRHIQRHARRLDSTSSVWRSLGICTCLRGGLVSGCVDLPSL